MDDACLRAGVWDRAGSFAILKFNDQSYYKYSNVDESLWKELKDFVSEMRGLPFNWNWRPALPYEKVDSWLKNQNTYDDCFLSPEEWFAEPHGSSVPTPPCGQATNRNTADYTKACFHVDVGVMTCKVIEWLVPVPIIHCDQPLQDYLLWTHPASCDGQGFPAGTESHVNLSSSPIHGGTYCYESLELSFNWVWASKIFPPPNWDWCCPEDWVTYLGWTHGRYGACPAMGYTTFYRYTLEGRSWENIWAEIQTRCPQMCPQPYDRIVTYYHPNIQWERYLTNSEDKCYQSTHYVSCYDKEICYNPIDPLFEPCEARFWDWARLKQYIFDHLETEYETVKQKVYCWVLENVSEQATAKTCQTMPDSELFYSLTLERNITLWITDNNWSNVCESVIEMAFVLDPERYGFNDHIYSHMPNILIATTQLGNVAAVFDLDSQYIWFFNGGPIIDYILIHEVAHSFAFALWKDYSPPMCLEGTDCYYRNLEQGVITYSDYGKAICSVTNPETEECTYAEPAPSEYGETNYGEDFAEAFRRYFFERTALQSGWPRRFAVVQRIVNEESYHG